MHLRVLPNLDTVSAERWNRLAGDHPFLRHEFLAALERSGCVGEDTGWLPCHLVLAAGDGEHEPLLGAVPLYLKHHSYGEYVFDWAWAEAYARHGRAYYPKLIAAVPFTPVTARRLLIAADADGARIAKRLIDGARELADRHRASSLHWLFPTAAEHARLVAGGFLSRTGFQFHWSNSGYRDFDDFLSGLTAHKRYNIRRERRRVREAGVIVEPLHGADVTPRIWDMFFDFYRATIHHHGGIAYLTRDFFLRLGATMAQQVVMFVARRQNEIVGTALCLRNADTLYGRYWGGHAGIADLHFETCYYAAIEYCIAQGLARCEAGAQGQHKLARGFVPVATYSAHWLRDGGFHRAVAEYLEREHESIEQHVDELNEHSPFRYSAQPLLQPRE